MEFYVSAPGKVILFGEHLAVYGKPAIAAALSLRAYLLVTPSEHNDLVLEFPDISLKHSWPVDALPWAQLAQLAPPAGPPAAPKALVPEILALLEPLLADMLLEHHRTTCLCFLYLYASLCGPTVAGHRFCIRLTLPIGAGLGLSALTAVCLASALAVLGGHVAHPKTGYSDEAAALIDDWSMVGERCFHGNPSGIDNAVATHGGAVWFQRKDGRSERHKLRGFAALELLLTNTKIPRSTAALVGGVAAQHAQFPAILGPVLDAMEHVVHEANAVLSALELDRGKLAELVNINHGLLVALGVLHPSLEKIKMLADTHGVGATKLTGAGGGGCAITLLKKHAPAAAVAAVKREFDLCGFETFAALLGGKGVGMLDSRALADDVRAEVFSPDRFVALPLRDAIEKSVGGLDWEFWSA